MTYGFFSEEPSDIERMFVAAFPSSGIAALVENSTVGEIVCSFIVSGQRVRLKHGCKGEVYTGIGDTIDNLDTDAIKLTLYKKL